MDDLNSFFREQLMKLLSLEPSPRLQSSSRHKACFLRLKLNPFTSEVITYSELTLASCEAFLLL